MTRMLAGALMILALCAGVSPGSAQVNVTINVGSSLNHGRGITCAEGRWMLQRRGFRDVRPRDCRGRVFVYSGRRSGAWWRVDVRSWDGRVVRMVRR